MFTLDSDLDYPNIVNTKTANGALSLVCHRNSVVGNTVGNGYLPLKKKAL